MKQKSKLAVMLLLVFALSACSNMPIQTVEVEVTRVIPQTVVVTEAVQEAAAPEGIFTTGTPIDIATLPALMEVPGGGGYEPCFVESTEPSINWGYGIFPSQSLCLNNFPTAPDSSGFTVTLTDLTGRTFSDTFTHNQGNIINSRGMDVGSIHKGSDSDDFPTTPGVSVEIYMPASFTCGDWSVSANTQDDSANVGSTILASDCSSPDLSVLSDLATNPFVSPEYSWEGPIFANSETIYVVGTAYPPNTEIAVALYQVDPSAGKAESGYPLGIARYAVSVMTDSLGNFQAPFIVGNGTQRGAYYAKAAPGSISAGMTLHFFSARFSIK